MDNRIMPKGQTSDDFDKLFSSKFICQEYFPNSHSNNSFARNYVTPEATREDCYLLRYIQELNICPLRKHEDHPLIWDNHQTIKRSSD